MTTQELKNIARENQLEVISHTNKYDTVVTGFKNLDQAREFADKYERNLCLVDIQPNAEFYTETYPRTEKIDTSYLRSIFVNEDIKEVKEQFCQGEFVYFDNSHVEDFQEVDIDETIEWMREEERSEKEIEEFLAEMNDIKKQIEELADNEIIVKDINDGRFFKVLARCEKDYFNEKRNVLTKIAVML